MDHPGPAVVPGPVPPEPAWSPTSWPPPTLAPRPSLWHRYGRHLFLFALTATSVFVTSRYAHGDSLAGALAMVAGIMSIMLAHEMGHYVACRIYGVDATLPFFIPFPVFSLVGTLGAVIRIKSPFPNRRALFDIGIAGPIAGFLATLPVLFLGILDARVVPTPPQGHDMISFGEPLLFHWMTSWLKGDIPDGQTVLIGPVGLAAWFGLFLTALNLIPVGQLDGGHATYALFRRKALTISRLAYVSCLALLWYRPTWLVWSIVLFFLGRRHPPTLDDGAPLGAGRIAVGVFSLAMLAVCFTPDPIVITWSEFLGPFADLGRALFRHLLQ